MELTKEQAEWASKRRQRVCKTKLRKLLIEQEGRCALSEVDMVFNKSEGTPVKGDRGCHPLYPAVDHKDPGNPEGGFQLVCYMLNDLKGHLPKDCFDALKETVPWKKLMNSWRKQAKVDPTDRETFLHIIRPHARRK